MKKIYSIALVSALLCACGEPQYKISGNVEGLDGMVYMLDSKRNPIDSVQVADGKFEFQGEFTEAKRIYITDNSDLSQVEKYVMLFIEEGKILVQENENGLFATGTPSNDAYSAYNDQAEKLFKEYDAEETTAERRNQIDEEYDQMTMQSVKDNLDNLFGMYQFGSVFYDLDGQGAIDLLEQFSDEFKASESWKSYMEVAQAKLNVADGKPYIDFAQNTPEGVELSLKSVVENPENKYVLVDFWASWCGPCMGEVPYLISDYEKYHDKGFEILGSSLDRDSESWTQAIESKGMNWLHVSDIKYWDNAAAALYAVRSIPANFLIDCSTGKIIAHDLRGEGLGSKLAELLD